LDLSIIQGPFSVAPCQTYYLDSQLFHRCTTCSMLVLSPASEPAFIRVLITSKGFVHTAATPPLAKPTWKTKQNTTGPVLEAVELASAWLGVV
jgi:hypothetical protein